MSLSLNDAHRKFVRFSRPDSLLMCCPSRNKLVTWQHHTSTLAFLTARHLYR